MVRSAAMRASLRSAWPGRRRWSRCRPRHCAIQHDNSQWEEPEMSKRIRFTRRQALAGAAAAAAVTSAPAFLRHAHAQANEFRVGMFYAIAGPAAALFGPTQKASAELAV